MRPLAHFPVPVVSLLVGLATTSTSAAPPGDAVEDERTDKDYQAFVTQQQAETLQRRLVAIQAQQEQLQQNTLARGRVYVHMVRLGLLPMSDGFDGMVAHANRAERLRRSLARDLVTQTRLSKEAKSLRAQLRAAQERQRSLNDRVLDYQRSREAIQAARERELAYRRAFTTGDEGRAHTAVYGAAQPELLDNVRFPDMRGRLPFPVKGRAEIVPAELDSAPGPGSLMTATPNAEVLSVFSGKVILTGPYGDLGTGIVIDHGDGYTTLAARLGSLAVKVGDVVRAGDTVGHLPAEGDGALYFEVRLQGVAVDPAAWFGI